MIKIEIEKKLRKYITDNILLEEKERETLRELKKILETEFSEGHTLMNGSIKRRTAIRGASDLDIIYRLKIEVENQEDLNISPIIEDIQKRLENLSTKKYDIKYKEQTHSIGITFEHKATRKEYEIDLVPVLEIPKQDKDGNILYQVPFLEKLPEKTLFSKTLLESKPVCDINTYYKLDWGKYELTSPHFLLKEQIKLKKIIWTIFMQFSLLKLGKRTTKKIMIMSFH